MSTMSTRFPYKERRVGKITKIALTRLTSTPSNPYGSRAEACQPETTISAPCQGHGNDTSPRTPSSETGAGLWIGSLVFQTPSIREEEEFLFSSFYRGRGGGYLASATLPPPVAVSWS